MDNLHPIMQTALAGGMPPAACDSNCWAYVEIDGVGLHCSFWGDDDEPGSPGGLDLMSANVQGVDITLLLSEEAVDSIKTAAMAVWKEEEADRRAERAWGAYD